MSETNIDWNEWYKPVETSLDAFDLDGTAYIAELLDLHWHSSEDDPVTAQSVMSVLRGVTKDLIIKHINEWKYDEKVHLENNTYYDDARNSYRRSANV